MWSGMMTLVTGATGHGKRAVIGLSRAKRRESLCYPGPNKSRIIYMIAGHRALGFGEIAASYGETIVTK
jgi:hypothetical protein